ncbi:MAG: 30S ribosomal protein S12 methylthiotransferase RimO [Planctomycetes bacterium]|nr:30S ribosomal protein S12 methylthiotransferase RimO [Planctomycetota bacterium]
MNEAIRVSLISLGCARNLVDSEVLLGHVAEEGLQITREPADADVVVVNTCGFIEDAKQESIDTILEVCELKAAGTVKGVLAVGCLSQRYGEELRRELPEVDAFLGITDYSGIPALIRKLVNGSSVRFAATVDGGRPKSARSDANRLLLTPKSYAYLRISEGCNHTCTFCAIPGMRGRNRSKPLDVLVEETRNLARAGVREVVVVAEDSTAYGLDIERARTLHRLLEALAEVEGIDWLRLMYAYPHTVGPELTAVLHGNPKVVPYLDIPIQHISGPMLRAMKRGVTSEQVRGILTRLRDEVPGIAVRTTFIVGFPGETEQDYAELRDYVAEYRFERMGVFPYSPEEGTPAFDLPGRVDPEVAEARQAELMELQRGIMAARNASLVGSTLPVLIDGRDPEGPGYLGRTFADAPEVDCVVKLDGPLQPGDLFPVRITAAGDYDLTGVAASAFPAPSDR